MKGFLFSLFKLFNLVGLFTTSNFIFMFSVLMASQLFAFSTYGAFGDKANSHGNEAEIKDPLRAKARFQPSAIEAGGTVDLIIELKLADKYHAYLDRFKLNIESPQDLKLAHFKVEPVVKFFDSVSKSQKDGVEKTSVMKALVEIPPGFKSGTWNADVKLVYQACTEQHCLFPKTIHLKIPFTVKPELIHDNKSDVKSSSRPIGAKETKDSISGDSSNEFAEAIRKGMLSAFALVFVVGFLTSLTPCIYPMIPITLAVLGARTQNQSHLKNFFLSLTYVLGIASTYSILGVIAASTGGLFGSALSNVWVVSLIAVVFAAMGLSMLGLFEIQAPAFIRNRIGLSRNNSGYFGAYGIGLVAGIVASPCIGPVLVSLLAYIAQTQNRLLGFSMLFTFALGMGIPFIVVGLSSVALRRMPKAGAWMEAVKFIFGTVMIGMAFYYIKPLYPVWLFRVLLGTTLILFASIYGAFTANEKLNAYTRVRKGAMLTLLAIGISLVTLGAVLGNKGGATLGYFLNDENRAGVNKNSSLAWNPYSDSRFERALKEGRPILIDFTAEWCGACAEMEDSTFKDKRIIDASQRFELLQVDGTVDTPALHQILNRFRVHGFPTYIFFDRNGNPRDDLKALGFDPAESFLKRMNALLAKEG